MAPNVKQLAYLTESLADLDLVQSKYLPLTHPAEPELQGTQEQEEQIQLQAPSTESASYWDWPADDEVAQEEAQDNLFSVESIEKNLIKDAQHTSSAEVIVAADPAENDYYWSEKVVESSTKPQHDDYWFTPADPKQARILAILNDEAARKLVSCDNIEKNIVQHRDSSRREQQKTTPANDAYWSWDCPASLDAELEEAYSRAYWDWSTEDSRAEVSKADLIQVICQYEAARKLLSAQHIEENLKQISLPECSHSKPCSDDYWSWSFPGTPADDKYWDWSARPVAACGYWDGM